VGKDNHNNRKTRRITIITDLVEVVVIEDVVEVEVHLEKLVDHLISSNVGGTLHLGEVAVIVIGAVVDHVHHHHEVVAMVEI
jgi:hypothetical protein